MEILKHAHSGLRWVLLALLLYAIYNAFTGWKSGRAFTDSDRKANLFTMITAHVQLLLGLALYFMNGWFTVLTTQEEVMKDSVLRFYTVEHLSMMIIAIILITIGYGKSKRGATDLQKFKTPFWMFLIALVVILAAIPWPMRFPNAGWF